MTSTIANNVAAAILAASLDQPDRPYLACEGESLSRGEFRNAVARSRARFVAGGAGAGSRVLVATGRGNQVWVDIVALWSLGATAIPVEPDVPALRMAAIRTRATPHAVVGDFNDTRELRGFVRLDSVNADPGGGIDFECAPVAAETLSTILFTSGSTGEPKGVMLPHRSVLGNALATRDVIQLHADDRLFTAIPFRFVSALSHFVVSSIIGATLIATERRMLQADFCRKLVESGASACGGSPLQARWIADAASQTSFPVRWLMSSGDHLPADVIERLRERLPTMRIVTAYGLTEVGGRFCILRSDLIDTHRGSVGRPIPNMRISILNDEGYACKPREIGEAYASGACVFDGYIGDPSATSESLLSRGFRTGDLGYFDEQGLVYLSGRADDVFKTAGLKVSSVPIVAALMKTGAFRDVAVLPVEDAVLGHVPHAYYVPAVAGQFDKAAVLRQLRATLPGFQIPSRFTELSEIPRTGSGKVDRKRLRALTGRRPI
jgi:acyl-coenzyme A synthetase/AMP-(fatty) acid ligase